MSLRSFVRDKKFRLLLLGLVAGAAVLIGTAAVATPKASADACTGLYPPGGRNCRTGYFYNTYEAVGHNVYTNGIGSQDLGNFLAVIGGNLACNGSVMSNDSQYADGSSFIILTMLGYPAGTNKNVACQQYGRWASLVTDYSNAGLINWNQYVSWIGNTYYQDQHDDGWVDPGAPTWTGSDFAIVFVKPDRSGAFYSIKHSCANPIGLMQPLQPIRPPTGAVTAATCSQITGNAVDPDTPNSSVTIYITFSRDSGPITTATNAGTHNFSVPTPAGVKNSLYASTVHVYAQDTNTGQRFEISGSPKTIGPCLVPAPQCAGYTITPDSLDPNTPFSLTAAVSYGSKAMADAIRAQTSDQFYLKITGPGVNYSSNTPVANTDESSTGVLSVTTNQPATHNTGTYVVTWGVSGGPGAWDCGGDGNVPTHPGGPDNPPATFDVTDKPYFSVTGGDASAGAGMSAGGTDCAVSADTKAGIVSWNRGAAGSYGGAGTKYAALALNHLQDFATGQGSSLAPSGVAFANTSDGDVQTSSGLFGGMYDALPCVQDYYATKPSNAKDLSNLAHGTGAYSVDGPTVFSGATLDPKDHWTVYVNGDLYISGSIKFSGSYANVADIPSLKVYVKGNIYISPSVNELDGMYVAQPTTATSGDGNIYTCASNSGSGQHPYHAASLNGSLYNACKTTLTVNGAFIANQVWLLRTAGTVSTSPAETFNFSPELWLSAPYDTSVTGTDTDQYDAITSLPPVL